MIILSSPSAISSFVEFLRVKMIEETFFNLWKCLTCINRREWNSFKTWRDESLLKQTWCSHTLSMALTFGRSWWGRVRLFSDRKGSESVETLITNASDRPGSKIAFSVPGFRANVWPNQDLQVMRGHISANLMMVKSWPGPQQFLNRLWKSCSLSSFTSLCLHKEDHRRAKQACCVVFF